MLEGPIAERACRTDTETFRKQLCEPDVQAVFRKHRVGLEAVFRHYAAADVNHREAFNSMNFDEFKQMLKDCLLLAEGGVTMEAAQSIFANVQSDEADAGTGAEADALSEMVYGEFLEVVSCLACYKFPSPYQPLAQRIDLFIANCILTRAHKAKAKAELSADGAGDSSRRDVTMRAMSALLKVNVSEEAEALARKRESRIAAAEAEAEAKATAAGRAEAAATSAFSRINSLKQSASRIDSNNPSSRGGGAGESS